MKTPNYYFSGIKYCVLFKFEKQSFAHSLGVVSVVASYITTEEHLQ